MEKGQKHYKSVFENEQELLKALEEWENIEGRTYDKWLHEHPDAKHHDGTWFVRNYVDSRLKPLISQLILKAREEGRKEPYAHDTVDEYCCACGYDITCMEEKIREGAREALENAARLVEGMKIHVIDAIDYNYNQALTDAAEAIRKSA